MPVTYSKDQRDKAKKEGLVLVTLDIYGRYAKRCGATCQGYLFSPAEVEKAWEFFNWLVTQRAKPKRGAKRGRFRPDYSDNDE